MCRLNSFICLNETVHSCLVFSCFPADPNTPRNPWATFKICASAALQSQGVTRCDGFESGRYRRFRDSHAVNNLCLSQKPRPGLEQLKKPSVVILVGLADLPELPVLPGLAKFSMD